MSTVPFDAADAFCVLYDGLRADAPDARAVSAVWANRPAIEELSNAIYLERGVPDGTLELSTQRGRLRGLFALDILLQQAVRDLATSGSTAVLPTIAIRLVRTGRLDSGDPAVGGALLARRAQRNRPGPPDYIDEALTSVVRVGQPSWGLLDHVLVRSAADLDPRLRIDSLRVGTLPFTHKLAEFQIDETSASAGIGYRVAPGARLPAERVRAAVVELSSSNVAVGLLPEAVLGSELLGDWRAACQAEGRGPSGLRWIMAGTGPVDDDRDPPCNTAVLIDARTGEDIARQDKRSRFTLTNDVIDLYGLRPWLPSAGDHEEDIDTTTRLTVVESAAGRFVIAICEDLSRVVEDFELIQSVGPTHVLVPMLSRGIREGDWVEQYGGILAEKIGATVVIVNSAAIAEFRMEAGIDDQPWYTAACVSPREGGGSEVKYAKSLHSIDVQPIEL